MSYIQIVPCKELKDVINHHMIGYYFFKGFILHNHVAEYTYKNRHLLENIQFNIRKYVPSSNINNLYPFKKLYKGMKVMFTKILYPKLGLINGTIYIVHEIVILQIIKLQCS